MVFSIKSALVETEYISDKNYKDAEEKLSLLDAEEKLSFLDAEEKLTVFFWVI